MIPSPITMGHVVMLSGMLVMVYSFAQILLFARYRGPEHGQGTPGYARRRDARRYAVWTLVAGALLIAAGCLTPLQNVVIR